MAAADARARDMEVEKLAATADAVIALDTIQITNEPELPANVVRDISGLQRSGGRHRTKPVSKIVK